MRLGAGSGAVLLLMALLSACGVNGPTNLVTSSPAQETPLPSPTHERLETPQAASQPSPTASRFEPTVVAEGVEYTCGTLAYGLDSDRRCGETGQLAFDRWGPGLDAFLRSELLATVLRDLQPMEARPLASFALFACLLSAGESAVEGPAGASFDPLVGKAAAFSQSFIEKFPSISAEDALHIYLAMTNELCPETLVR